jgi:hypothetical protein
MDLRPRPADAIGSSHVAGDAADAPPYARSPGSI